MKKQTKVFIPLLLALLTLPVGSYAGAPSTFSNMFYWEGYLCLSNNLQMEIIWGPDWIPDLKIPSKILGVPVTSIRAEAWGYSLNLRSVTIPHTVTNIGEFAFALCYNLEYVKLGNGMKVIGACAFGFCGLREIDLGNSLEIIGPWAFESCDLRSITIPKSVVEIGYGAFLSCNELTDIRWQGARDGPEL